MYFGMTPNESPDFYTPTEDGAASLAGLDGDGAVAPSGAHEFLDAPTSLSFDPVDTAIAVARCR